MSDTPITDKIIADADANQETRIVFLIKHLANKCKEFERAAAVSELRQSKEPDLAMMIRRLAARLRTRATMNGDVEMCDKAHDMLVRFDLQGTVLRDGESQSNERSDEGE